MHLLLSCSVCFPAEGFQVRLQDRDPFMPRALITPHQHTLGEHDGEGGSCEYMTKLATRVREEGRVGSEKCVGILHQVDHKTNIHDENNCNLEVTPFIHEYQGILGALFHPRYRQQYYFITFPRSSLLTLVS